MALVTFHGGPYCGKQCDLPFLPQLLVGIQMDGDCGPKDGVIHVDLKPSKYIYQLTHPNGENEPFLYRLREWMPQDLAEWYGDDLRTLPASTDTDGTPRHISD